MDSPPVAWEPVSPVHALTGKLQVLSRPNYLSQKLINPSVNMYASTWICTKTEDISRPKNLRTISALSLPDSAIPTAKRSGSVEDLQL
jgi:hypothetical protein